MKFDLAECKFTICKKWILSRRCHQRAKTVIYSMEMAGILSLPSRVRWWLIKTSKDLTRSLSEAVSRAVSETVSAVPARVSIKLELQYLRLLWMRGFWRLINFMPFSQNSPANQHVPAHVQPTASTPTSTIQQVSSVARNLCKEGNRHLCYFCYFRRHWSRQPRPQGWG